MVLGIQGPHPQPIHSSNVISFVGEFLLSLCGASISHKAIVLSHTKTPIEERMPYHSLRLQPLRPVIFFGRSAKEEPTINVKKAMCCFYRDAGEGNLSLCCVIKPPRPVIEPFANP